jgi:hypothetical protein
MNRGSDGGVCGRMCAELAYGVVGAERWLESEVVEEEEEEDVKLTDEEDGEENEGEDQDVMTLRGASADTLDMDDWALSSPACTRSGDSDASCMAAGRASASAMERRNACLRRSGDDEDEEDAVTRWTETEEEEAGIVAMGVCAGLTDPLCRAN